jgi:hypothetical protein
MLIQMIWNCSDGQLSGSPREKAYIWGRESVSELGVEGKSRHIYVMQKGLNLCRMRGAGILRFAC